MLELGASRVGEIQGEVAYDEHIALRSSHPAREPVILEPEAGVGLPTVLCDVGGGSVLTRHPGTSDAEGKHLGTQRFRAHAPIVLVIIMATPEGSVIFGDRPLLVVVVVLAAAGVDGETRVAISFKPLFD